MENMKINLYNQFIEFMVDSMALTLKKQNPTNIKKLGIRLQAIGLKMVLVSSDIVVKKFIEWRALAIAGTDPEGIFKAFSEVLIEIRKELQGETSRTVGDVLDIMT